MDCVDVLQGLNNCSNINYWKTCFLNLLDAIRSFQFEPRLFQIETHKVFLENDRDYVDVARDVRNYHVGT